MIRFWDSKLTGAPPLLSLMFGGGGGGNVDASAKCCFSGGVVRSRCRRGRSGRATGAPRPGPGQARSGLGEAEAARAAYEDYATRHAFDTERMEVDTLYRWSLRWAEADARGGKRPAAYAAHLDRMKKLAEWCAGVVKHGKAHKSELSATAFYVAEAERLSADAK